MAAVISLLAALPWTQILGWAMPFIIMGVVQILKSTKPQWSPYIPIIAPILGALLPPLAMFLSGLLGVPVDFSPILILFGLASGTVAVGLHQIPKQLSKRPGKGQTVNPPIEIRKTG